MGHREFKDQLYAEFARIGKALASPQRLELLDLLAQGERTVEDLAGEAALPIANASQHLHVLREARLVDSRKAGLYTLWRALREVGERQLAEINRLVETYMRYPEHLEPLSRDDLVRRLEEGDAILLDVRPALEYQQGHITGARSIPVEQMSARLDELNHDQEVVAYCRGPYCVFADEAVALLRERGFTARRYVEGYPEWAAAGLPIEREPASIETTDGARKGRRG
jgi:rhodanese-related sulfurtransferase